MKNVSNTEADLKKSVAYKKNWCSMKIILAGGFNVIFDRKLKACGEKPRLTRNTVVNRWRWKNL